MGSQQAINLGKRIVGPGSPIMIVAEIGVNHNGDESLARQLIDRAAEAGADAVKFQAFVPEALCSAVHRRAEMEMLRRYALPRKGLFKLRDRADAKGLVFLCTPFDFKSLDLVIELGCPAIKIGSGELTHTPFLNAVGSSGLPVILSTGAASRADIIRAIGALRMKAKPPVALLHCVSSYPAADECMNLRAIRTLARAFPDCHIGLSDHSEGIIAAVASAALGAALIEKHVTLDRGLKGPDHGASSEIEEFAELVRGVRRTEAMIGDGVKKMEQCEGVIGHSIVAARDLAAGTVISENDLAYKRPGSGLRPYLNNKLLGRRLKMSLKADSLFTLDMVSRA